MQACNRWSTQPCALQASRRSTLVVSRRLGSDCGRALAELQQRRQTRFSTLQPLASSTNGSVSASSSGDGAGSSKAGSSQDLAGEVCETFISAEGEIMEVMCCDYGFRTGNGRLYQDDYGKIPKSGFGLAWDNFKYEYGAIRRSFREDEYSRISTAAPPKNPIKKFLSSAGGGVVKSLSNFDKFLEDKGIIGPLPDIPFEAEMTPIDPEPGATAASDCTSMRDRLQGLKLDDHKVNAREAARAQRGEAVQSPWYIKAPYVLLCWTLDLIYPNRPIQRFWFLETVARMPYFAYISMLHLYESLGWWRAGAELRKVHFAEEWNELHHLQIMESLGGDELWIDRFLSQHAQVFYFWMLVLFYFCFPSLAYNFSELVEGHAVDTYSEFVDENEALLRTLPPPLVALQYYKGDDLYMFDNFMTTVRAEPRRPSCRNLYDVFINIRDDEIEHFKTMGACQSDKFYADLQARRDAPYLTVPMTSLPLQSDAMPLGEVDRPLGKTTAT